MRDTGGENKKNKTARKGEEREKTAGGKDEGTNQKQVCRKLRYFWAEGRRKKNCERGDNTRERTGMKSYGGRARWREGWRVGETDEGKEEKALLGERKEGRE